MPDNPVAQPGTLPLEIDAISLVRLDATNALLNARANQPATLSARWRADGGAWRDLGTHDGAEATFRLVFQHIHQLDVQVSAAAAGQTVSASRSWTLNPVQPTIDRVVANPSRLRRGDPLTLTISGSDFGPTAGASLQLYNPNGTLIAELSSTHRAGDLRVSWSDDRVQLVAGPAVTGAYPLGQRSFKARVVHAGGVRSNLAWGSFTVVS